MGGAVVIPVIMEILTDFLARPVSDSRHDTDTTEPNAPRLIYLAGWNTKTPIDGRLLSFLFTFDPDT